MKPKRALLSVGVAGTVGSGKSTLCTSLASRGAFVIDADAIGRSLLQSGTAVHDKVLAAFGPSILDSYGEVDRARLASIVFAEPRALRKLNAISGPAIAAEIRKRLRDLAKSGFDGIAVVDAALLRDWNPRTLVDCIVVVESSEASRRARTLAAGRLGEEEFERRNGAQKRRAGSLPAPDFVLYNDGTREDFERKAGVLWEHLRARQEPARQRSGPQSRQEPARS